MDCSTLEMKQHNIIHQPSLIQKFLSQTQITQTIQNITFQNYNNKTVKQYHNQQLAQNLKPQIKRNFQRPKLQTRNQNKLQTHLIKLQSKVPIIQLTFFGYYLFIIDTHYQPMPHGISQSIDPATDDKNKTKRYLARQLIQHIITLYDSIIQKIEHGIGLLWEEYFSQELFHIAKLRVEHELINDIDQLNAWFQKLSANIRDKVTNFSANLLSHFDQIIKAQVDFLNHPVVELITFDNAHQLEQKQQQKYEDPLSQNKLNQSLYETCTQSSRGQRKKCPHQRLQTVSSQSISSQDVSRQLLEDGNFELDTDKYQSQQVLPQVQTNEHTEQSHRYKRESPQRLRKMSQNEDSDCEEQADGGFYGVFLGILEAFDM